MAQSTAETPVAAVASPQRPFKRMQLAGSGVSPRVLMELRCRLSGREGMSMAGREMIPLGGDQELLPLGTESRFQPGHVAFMIRHLPGPSRDLNPLTPLVRKPGSDERVLLIWPRANAALQSSGLGELRSKPQQDGGTERWQDRSPVSLVIVTSPIKCLCLCFRYVTYCQVMA